MVSIIISLEALLLTVVLSIDVFAVSFAYGSSKIKIPFKSMMVITVIGSIILGVSLYFGVLVQQFIPYQVAGILSFSILFLLGLFRIFDSALKSFIRKHSNASKKVEFSLFNFKFILNVYADPEKADIDNSRTISPKEAVAVAVAVAIDALVLGFGAGLVDVNHLQIIAFSLVLDVIAIVLGCYIGGKVATKFAINLSWLGGLILIALAIL